VADGHGIRDNPEKQSSMNTGQVFTSHDEDESNTRR